MFFIPLDFEMLTLLNLFFQHKLKDRLSYELTFNSNGRVMVSTETTAIYKGIHLEYETVNSPDLVATLYDTKQVQRMFSSDA